MDPEMRSRVTIWFRGYAVSFEGVGHQAAYPKQETDLVRAMETSSTQNAGVTALLRTGVYLEWVESNILANNHH